MRMEDGNADQFRRWGRPDGRLETYPTCKCKLWHPSKIVASFANFSGISRRVPTGGLAPLAGHLAPFDESDQTKTSGTNDAPRFLPDKLAIT